MAINKALNNLRQGEQIQLIAPWYTAYGVEGTAIIKPYSNLRIVVKVGE
jgi:FKBP-type peptidyl-prolyl cis-trans isomerase